MRTRLFPTYGLVSFVLLAACSSSENGGLAANDAASLQPDPAAQDATSEPVDDGAVRAVSLDAGPLQPDAGNDDASADAGDAAVDAAAACPEYSGEISEPMEIGPGCVKITELEVTAKLTILPGTRVEFKTGGTLYTKEAGSIHALGTAETPVTFTSGSETPAPGDWSCIHLDSHGGERSVFQHVVVEYGGSACQTATDAPGVMLRVDGFIDTVADTTFRHSAGKGVQLFAPPRLFRANSFDDNAEPSLETETAYMGDIQAPEMFTDANDYVSIIDGNSTSLGTVTWRNLGVPWRFDSSARIDEGEVTIEPGTHLQLIGGGMEIWGATLNAVGTADAPILWTSALANPAPGDWGCLDLDQTSATLNHNIFEYAGGGCAGQSTMALGVSFNDVVLSNLIFRNITGHAIESWQNNNECEETVAAQNWCSFTFENVSSATPLTCDDDPMCSVQ